MPCRFRDCAHPCWGTGSGLKATVGGSLSQNAANYGSARYGTIAESVLGLKVVLAKGQQLETGSWSTTDHPTPFDRQYGPDLTGLFLGDGGAFGIKGEIALRLIPRPEVAGYKAYGFDHREDMVEAMAQIGASGADDRGLWIRPPFFCRKELRQPVSRTTCKK